MKIDMFQLKEAYQGILEDNRPASRESCSSPEDLLLLVRSKLSRRDQAKIMDHAVRCPLCLGEIKKLLDITKEENKFILNLNEALNSAVHSKPHQGRSFARRLSWNYVSAISISIFLIVIATYAILHVSSKSDLRRGATTEIHLISPAEKEISAAELKFVWDVLTNAKYYVLEAFDASLDLVWRSEPVTANEFRPPRDVIQKFRPNEIYFWMVTAVQESGNKSKSGMKEFSIKE
jgi:hypothetical protein